MSLVGYDATGIRVITADLAFHVPTQIAQIGSASKREVSMKNNNKPIEGYRLSD